MPRILNYTLTEPFKINFEKAKNIEDIPKKSLAPETGKIVLHFSPSIILKSEFELHKDGYLNHIILSWGIFPYLFDKKKRKRILKDIKDYIWEEKNNQIKWGKINQRIFQNLILDIVKREKNV